MVPLAVGGGDFPHWDRVRDGLVAGTDPDGPEYWGAVGGTEQRMVEMAAIGTALAFVPQHVWDPLPRRVQENLVRWLDGINRHEPLRSNWQLFRLLADLGLERVGAPFDERARDRSYGLVDSFYEGDGWYADGEGGHHDHYLGWTFHSLGLIHAASGLGDAGRSTAYRERARAFAPRFRQWFDAGGAAIPFGRSLTYRFAQGAFWSALVLADEEALPWGEVKGLLLRHLRWWATMPIARADGVLAPGDGYDNRRLLEEYSSAGSPYWAMQAFLALGAPADHPLWRVEEAPLEPVVSVDRQPRAGMILTRDRSHAVALSGGQSGVGLNEMPAKYARFAYSSRLGWAGDRGFGDRLGPSDSMLTLTDPRGVRRVRTTVEHHEVVDGAVWSRWRPFDDVVVDTVLCPLAEGHVRVHRISTAVALRAEECGFSVGCDVGVPEILRVAGGEEVHGLHVELGGGLARVTTTFGSSALASADDERDGRLLALAPNAHLLWPHAAVPALRSTVAPGTSLLVVAVHVVPGAGAVAEVEPPEVPAVAAALLAGRSGDEANGVDGIGHP